MRSNRRPSFPPRGLAALPVALCACLALAACNRSAPASAGDAASSPQPDASAAPAPLADQAAPSPSGTDGGPSGASPAEAPTTTVADAGAPSVCAELDRMLTGKPYAAARDALKAAGYRLVPPEAEEGGTQKLAGDPVFCGNQGCTAAYASGKVKGLTLTVDMDEDKPQAQWEVGGWDLPECRRTQ